MKRSLSQIMGRRLRQGRVSDVKPGRLRLDTLEAREMQGSLMDGLVHGMLGGVMPDPLAVMNQFTTIPAVPRQPGASMTIVANGAEKSAGLLQPPTALSENEPAKKSVGSGDSTSAGGANAPLGGPEEFNLGSVFQLTPVSPAGGAGPGGETAGGGNAGSSPIVAGGGESPMASVVADAPKGADADNSIANAGGSGSNTNPPSQQAAGTPVLGASKIVPPPAVSPTFVSTPNTKVIPEAPAPAAPKPSLASMPTSQTPLYAVGPDAGARMPVRVYDAKTQTQKFEFSPYGRTYSGGVRVAMADVTGDGTADIITGQGVGNRVRVYNGATGAPLPGLKYNFSAFTAAESGSVSVAGGDINGDGRADIIVGSNGAVPAVKVFDGSTGGLIRTISLEDSGISGPVSVGAGNVNGDGIADVVAAGANRVVVSDGKTGHELQNYFAFDQNYKGGINLAVADVTKDGYADVIAGQAAGDTWLKIFSGRDSGSINNMQAFPGSTAGVRVAVADINADGTPDLLAGDGPSGGSVRMLSSGDGSTKADAKPYGPEFASGTFVAADARPAAPKALKATRSAANIFPPSYPIASITISSAGDVIEGQTARFIITVSGSSTDPGPSAYAGYNFGGTATSLMDYSPIPNNPLGLTRGQTKIIEVPTGADTIFENEETIVFNLLTQPTSPFYYPFQVVGSSSVSIKIRDKNAPSVTANTGQTCPPSGNPASVDPGAGSPGSGDVSPESGIRYSDGTLKYSKPDLSSGGFGQNFGVTRSWTNSPGYDSSNYEGNNTVLGEVSYLKRDSSGTVVAIGDGTTARYFDNSAGSLVSRNFNKDKLTYVAGTGSNPGEYTLVTSAGVKMTYFDFNSSLPAAQQGQVKSVTDPDGNVTTITARTTDGKPLETQRTSVNGSSTTTESFLYSYLATGTNSGKIDTVTLRRKVDAGAWTTVRSSAYTYYDTASSLGTAGDVKTAVTRDAAGQAITRSYSRYYTASSATGYAGALKYTVTDDAYDRFVAAYPNPDDATDAQVAVYADHYFEYDSAQRVTKHTQAGTGCSSCTGGLGTTTLAYTNSSFADGYNNWRTKTVETLADGTINTVYTNFVGQPILRAAQPAGSTDKWCTYQQFDSKGRLILTAQPSAISGFDETFADLLNNQSGDYQYLRNSQGLIQTITYGTSTTATATVSGTVDGYQNQTFIKRGETGTAVLQTTTQYFSRTDGTITVYPVAGTATYRNTNGTGGQASLATYEYFNLSIQPQKITVTRPTATTAQNGSNTAESDVSVMDDRGRVIWTRDAAGYLNYTAYDDVTGGVTKTIRDVNTTQTSTFANLPSGWTTPAGGGLQQTTTYELDDQGRPTKTTDPNGNITHAVYNDAAHETRVYTGWDSATNTTTGPITVIREDRGRGYTETLTMSATPTVASGRPTGAEAISGVQTLSRQVLNSVGQVIAADQYTDLAGVTYSASSVTLGTAGTNYLRTAYAYDDRGRLRKTVTPGGTIYRTVYDGLGRSVSRWVGTDDVPTTGFWSPTNTAGTDLVKVSESEYDNAGVGDGNLTKQTEIPGGGAANRVTAYAYDWRNRLAATKAGVEASESTSLNRPVTYTEYDNLGQAIVSEQYDGDGLSITADANTDGVPDRPSASALRAKSVMSYDEQGRVFKSETFSVDPSSGTVSTAALTTNNWFDSRGNTIKTASPGGVVSKSEFDGLGRMTKNYTTDGGGDSAYADAGNVTGDIVLTQGEMTYDIGGRLLLTTSRERFHDETATGPLGTPTTGAKARVSYQANYYDKADRTTASVDVGTNGGVAYTRPATVPARSDTTLVTEYGYDAAGWVETTTDPRGLIGKQYYDAAQRTIKTIENYVDGVVADTDDKTVNYVYASNGQLQKVRAGLTGGGVQETEYVFGVTPAQGSTLTSNEMRYQTKHPDASAGTSSATEVESGTFNNLGQTLTKTDRNGSVHTYAYDVVGRQISDTVTTLGAGVDGSTRRVVPLLVLEVSKPDY